MEVLVIQGVSGWDMGMCRIPLGSNLTYPVNFAGGEIIDMQVQINNINDNDVYRALNRRKNGMPGYVLTDKEVGDLDLQLHKNEKVVKKNVK